MKVPFIGGIKMKPTGPLQTQAGLCPQKINTLFAAQTVAAVTTRLSKKCFHFVWVFTAPSAL